VEVAQTTTDRRARPGGTRFGTLVHAALADVPFEAEEDTVRGVCALHARLLGATPDEIDAAVEAVEAALAHPLMKKAAAAKRVCREHDLVYALGDGTLLEGSVDLAFLAEDGWTVIDFKTDADAGERATAYRHQVSLYARAIERATGERARGVLLSV
jgi:ATP-dependent exoDNAse (exonuclease V) beta subunit